MAVDEQRNRDNTSDRGLWSRCAITWQRSYVSCAFVAVTEGDGEEVMRSPLFRWRRGGGAPVEAPDAVASLAALEQTLAGEGWERIDEPPDDWYALRFRRSVVPLTQRIAPYRAEGALIAFVEPGSADEPVETGLAIAEPVREVEAEEPPPTRTERQGPETAPTEAERLEAERLEAERLEAERLEAERLEAERREAERLEAERAEAERVEAERLESERREAQRREAERLEAERLEAERLEAERREAERLEAERLEAERLEAEQLEAERLEAERLAAERAEAERLAAERESPLRDLITSYSANYERDLDVRRIYLGTTPQFDPDRFTRKFRRRRR